MTHEPIEYRAIRIDAHGVSEMDRPPTQDGSELIASRAAADHRTSSAAPSAPRLVHVPHSEVFSLEAGFGSAAERPVSATILAVVLLLIALYPYAFLAAVFIWGGHMNTMLFWLSSLAVPAIWIFGLVFRDRDLLLVHTRRGSRRLIFHGSGEQDEIAAFLENAANSFGYRIGPSVSEHAKPKVPGARPGDS